MWSRASRGKEEEEEEGGGGGVMRELPRGSTHLRKPVRPQLSAASGGLLQCGCVLDSLCVCVHGAGARAREVRRRMHSLCVVRGRACFATPAAVQHSTREAALPALHPVTLAPCTRSCACSLRAVCAQRSAGGEAEHSGTRTHLDVNILPCSNILRRFMCSICSRSSVAGATGRSLRSEPGSCVVSNTSDRGGKTLPSRARVTWGCSSPPAHAPRVRTFSCRPAPPAACPVPAPRAGAA